MKVENLMILPKKNPKKYLKDKSRIIKTQIFHHAKI
jgi:hypothetical protein